MTGPCVRLTSIRNMTWNGKQGFQTPIEDESFIVDGMGVYGNMHEERGLTGEYSIGRTSIAGILIGFTTDVEFAFSGHMTPREY